MNVLECHNVTRAFKRGINVLDDISFSLAPGEVVGLLGRNGAGKTTLIRTAMGMIRPQVGTVTVFGFDPSVDSVAVKKRLGYVSENQILPPKTTVERVIDLHRSLYPTWDDVFATELLERFGLLPKFRINQLSKGQARQVALICAVAHRPELLLLDEPAGGLDSVARREFLETAVRLLAESGTAILFSSHHMNDVERLAQRVVMLQEGRVFLDCGLDELREDYCRVIIPDAKGATPATLQHLEGFIAARVRGDAVHAVFHLDPDRTAELVERGLRIKETICSRLPLEELFIELAGGTI
jgi:ABC-2 type transport system ATP-binding protein